MTKRSQAVDNAIKRSYAKLANATFKRALAKIEFDNTPAADALMSQVEEWLDKAGAKATQWYFN